METKKILQEIDTLENKLLIVSKKIEKAREFGSIELWIAHVLERDRELATHFVIPTDARIRRALLTLIKTNSPLTLPIIKLLSTRIASYIAIIDDLRYHPMIGPTLKAILDNFEPLERLIRTHDVHFEPTKSIDVIHQALKDNRLSIYQSYPREPDLRIVLKTLQQDASRDDEESLHYLLEFLFAQLKRNLIQPGLISQQRHGWWALLDLLVESDPEWLDKNREDLSSILLSFLNAPPDTPGTWDPTSVVPEMNSRYNEKVWVSINMMRVYRTSIDKFIPPLTIAKLKIKIESNLRDLIKDDYDSIRSNQCKLLVLYEALEYQNYVEVVNICNKDQIDIKGQSIGKYLYNNGIVDDFRPIKSSIGRLIVNRENWTKHMLSSLLISGPAGSGKSELMRQVIDEIKKTAEANEKEFHEQFITIGKNINTAEQLQDALTDIQTHAGERNKVRVVAFDEFDKAGFNFPLQFLEVLAAGTKNEDPVTFWIFGQSSYPTFHIYKSFAESQTDKTLRDFLTRIQLGSINIPELKVSPQQKIFTALGYMISKNPALESVSRSCVGYFATNAVVQNNRELITEIENSAHVEENKLSLRNGFKLRMNGIAKSENEWIRIVR